MVLGETGKSGVLLYAMLKTVMSITPDEICRNKDLVVDSCLWRTQKHSNSCPLC